MWEVMVINFALALVHTLLHDPAKATVLKKQLLLVRDAISATYPGE